MNLRVSPIKYILLQSETVAVRFWFGLVSIFYSLFLSAEAVNHWEYTITFDLMPAWMWSCLLAFNGISYIRSSLTNKYGINSMLMEGILGTLLWVSLSITSMMSQGTPGAVTVAGALSVWLLIRYPTWNSN